MSRLTLEEAMDTPIGQLLWLVLPRLGDDIVVHPVQFIGFDLTEGSSVPDEYSRVVVTHPRFEGYPSRVQDPQSCRFRTARTVRRCWIYDLHTDVRSAAEATLYGITTTVNSFKHHFTKEIGIERVHDRDAIVNEMVEDILASCEDTEAFADMTKGILK